MKKTNKETKEEINTNKGNVNYDVFKNAVEGEVVTRFPPEPSGYLHIGHVKAAMLNYYYAKRYKGRMLLRFDDTNTKKEKSEYFKAIKEDLCKLGIVPDAVSYTSDHFELLMTMMTKLIKDGKCYCDNIPQEEMQKNRDKGLKSESRDNSIEENLSLWELMQANDPRVRDYCVRAKISVDDKNKCLRDPVFYRFIDEPHFRTGDKYKLYPTYDYSIPIVDSIEGVTHTLRTDEYFDRNPMYEWVINITGLRMPEIFEFSRLNFQYTILSKRSLKWFVEEGLVAGWNDPRFPTVQGILRRGLCVEAMKSFMLLQGPSRNTNMMEWDKIWSMNKDILDPTAKRFMVVNSSDCVQLEIDNFGENAVEVIDADFHPKIPELGTKVINKTKNVFIDFDDAKDCKVGERLTLLKWGNITITSIDKVENLITMIHAKQDLNDKDFKKTRKLHWISTSEKYNTKLILQRYDNLITVKKMDEKTKLADVVNKKTKYEVAALGEMLIRELKKGEHIQIERRGYFICDEAYKKDTNSLTLIYIPDGGKKSTSNIN